MYRSRDEAFMTKLRHQLMLNEGTPWLVDRRWAYRYFRKYLLLDDLHTWATQAAPGVTIPMGVGPLEPQVVVVTPTPITADEQKFVLDILRESGLQKDTIYWTCHHRVPAGIAGTLDEDTLLASELNILSAPLILSFAVSVKGTSVPDFSTVQWKEGVLLQLPPLAECEKLRSEVIAAIKRHLGALTNG